MYSHMDVLDPKLELMPNIDLVLYNILKSLMVPSACQIWSYDSLIFLFADLVLII